VLILPDSFGPRGPWKEGVMVKHLWTDLNGESVQMNEDEDKNEDGDERTRMFGWT